MSETGFRGRPPRVAVLGAGIVGVTSAHALAAAGCRVTLLDRAVAPGLGGATARNGAQLSYANSNALASPALLRQLPALLLGRVQAARLRPRLSAGFLRWCLGLLRNCSGGRFDANTLAVLELALESRLVLAELRQRHALAFDFRAPGKMHLYRSRDGLPEVRRVAALKQRLGVPQALLTPAEAVAREPALAALAGPLAAALWSPEDEAGDAAAFSRALADLAVREYGLTLCFGQAAESIVLRSGRVVGLRSAAGEIEADAVVVALGSEAPALLRPLGLRLPIQPLRGYSVTLPLGPRPPEVSLTETAARIVFCRLGDRLRIAGMADLGPPRLAERSAALLAAARGALPEAADYTAEPEAWTGLRPMTPDGRPIVGRTRIPGLFLNVGHGMLGWTLALGSARRLAASFPSD